MTDEEMDSIDRRARQEENEDFNERQYTRYLNKVLWMDSTDERVRRKIDAMLQDNQETLGND